MKKAITNIYVLIDNSHQMKYHRERAYDNVRKIKRALQFLPLPTKLHVWQFADMAQLWHPTSTAKPSGNPDLGVGLKMLKNVLVYERKNGQRQNNNNRSIFLLFTGERVLRGWESPLKELFALKEFAFGLRYVVSYGNADSYTKRAHTAFVENPTRILRHFSANRLCALVRTLRPTIW